MSAEKIIVKPSVYFSTPQDLINYKGMNIEQKIKALINWKDACIKSQLSSSVGMGQEENSNLQDVSRALSRLKDQSL